MRDADTSDTLKRDAEKLIYPYFETADLSVEKLLQEWGWLCPQNVRLVAVDAFGDLFLEDERGAVLRLDTSGGKLAQISESVGIFKESADSAENRRRSFFEDT